MENGFSEFIKQKYKIVFMENGFSEFIKQKYKIVL